MSEKLIGLEHLEPRTRMIPMDCSYCVSDFNVLAKFGHFIRLNEGTACALLEERQGRKDVIVRDIICPNCGCASGIEFSKVKKTDPAPTPGLVV